MDKKKADTGNYEMKGLLKENAFTCQKIQRQYGTAWLWWRGAAIFSVLLFCISGCNQASLEKTTVLETMTSDPAVSEQSQEDTEEIFDICMDLYSKAVREHKPDDLETVRGIVNYFGENGYPAVDSKNQINMTEAEQVVAFCEKVDAQEKGEITIIVVSDLGGFVKYDLRTEDGAVDVSRSYYKYENGTVQKDTAGSYRAEYWNYTEEGYLMFSGVWYLNALYVLTLSGVEEHAALRVRPMDETCRELTRNYLLPIGFARNNMFIVDWSESDFGTLNFYDLYDLLYRNVNGDYVSFTLDDNAETGPVYRIPKEEFERVIMSCFNIESEMLRSKTVYYAEDLTYEYRPRGCDEAEYPEYPFSEVTDYTENEDGTITLLANVVFPYAGNSKLYVHEVVVRPLENGGVQYVSNRIIPSENNWEATWHTHRFTTEEWKKWYGGK